MQLVCYAMLNCRRTDQNTICLTCSFNSSFTCSVTFPVSLQLFEYIIVTLLNTYCQCAFKEKQFTYVHGYLVHYLLHCCHVAHLISTMTFFQ